MLYRLAKWYVSWCDDRADRRAQARAERLFPTGSKVQINGHCCYVGKKREGEIGIVEGPTSALTDWWVRFSDGKNDIFCAKGMHRLP